jgi:hypothetical protein
MKKLITSFAVIALFVATQAFQCNKGECNKDTMCTTEFRSISVTITPGAGNTQPITIDVYDYNNDKFIRNNSAASVGGTNTYEIINDGDFGWLGKVNEFEKFRVDIKVGNTVVKSEDYMLGRDCCHVLLSSGNTNVIL